MPPLPAASHKENSSSTSKDGEGTLGPAGVPSQGLWEGEKADCVLGVRSYLWGLVG